jgi:hypothetical protein
MASDLTARGAGDGTGGASVERDGLKRTLPINTGLGEHWYGGYR